MGVAEQDMGVRRLLEALAKEVPEPDVRPSLLGLAAEGGAVVQVLKNYYLPHAGKLSLARIWRGSVKDGTTLGDMRVGGVYRLFGGQQQNVGSAEAGEIVALARLDGARTGAVLGAAGTAALPQPPATRHMYAFAVTAANRNDEVKLSGAFAKLTDEDPALHVETDRETHQTILWGQGEIHLRVALDRLKNKYHVEVAPEVPRTPYRETIRKGAQAHGRHKKQSGGHGQFGDVKLEIRPLPARRAASSSRTRSSAAPCRASSSPRSRPARASICSAGPLGFAVVDVAVSLHDGQFHSVDSNELSFKLATGQALKDGLPQCDPVLLEPILSVTISVPVRLHRQGTAAGLRQARPDHGLRGQARLERLGRDQRPDPAGRDARPDRLAALAEPGHRLLRVDLRPPAGGARPAGAGDRRQAPRSRGIAGGESRREDRPAHPGEFPCPRKPGWPERDRRSGGRPGALLLRAARGAGAAADRADPGLPLRAAAGDPADAGPAGRGRRAGQELASARRRSRRSCRRR